MRKSTWIWAILGLALASCGNGPENQGQTEEAETLDPAIIEQSNPNTGTGDKALQKIAEVQFEKNRHNFGKVKYQQPVIYYFEFTNTGETDLVILEAKASCGCTTPEWPKEPIKPGEKGKIKVGFKSTAEGPFNKQINVEANTNPQTTVLTIVGEVLKDPANQPN
ncbi:MAG: DUF1573 domain-containing protein [Bacteroidetes bacterium]|jgi:hypothetical protein|nr:DUF1573 domain-containing protein [Bacteroidota bacterium]